MTLGPYIDADDSRITHSPFEPQIGKSSDVAVPGPTMRPPAAFPFLEMPFVLLRVATSTWFVVIVIVFCVGRFARSRKTAAMPCCATYVCAFTVIDFEFGSLSSRR